MGKFRTIRLRLGDLCAAIDRAHKVSREWQAECCEIAMLPQIAKRWREANANLPYLQVLRVKGIPYAEVNRDKNLARGQARSWDKVAGYRLVFFKDEKGQLYGWNTVADDWYAHSAGSTWNGATRETMMAQTIHDLRMIVWCFREGVEIPSGTSESLEKYGIAVYAPDWVREKVRLAK